MLTAALAALLALVTACGTRTTETGGDGHPGHAAGEEVAAGDGHDHGEGEEPSDLDRPVDELFAASCEHGLKTHACAECRYEVGVVHAPARLFQEGLMKQGRLERRQVETPLTLLGEVVFEEGRVTHLRATTPGLIRTVRVGLGDRVERGQVLLELESAEAGEAQERLREAQSGLARATRDFERADELRRQGVSSEREFLLARQELDAAGVRLETARIRLASLGLDEQDPPGRLLLRAPAAGTVLALHAVAGESAHPEESLATVGDNRVLWVWCDLYERDIPALLGPGGATGRVARVSVKAWPGQSFPGRVEFVSPAMDEGSRTAKVRVAVENPDRRLLAGMFAQVQVFLPGGESVPALPAAAICEDEGRSFVFVPHGDDYYVRRPVTPGRRWGDWVDWVEVVEPVGLGTVVAEGVFLMKSDVLRSKMGAGCAD